MRPASFILTKDQIFWSKSCDQHAEIIKDNTLAPADEGNPMLLRVEITPPDGDLSSDTKDWVWKIVQDILPAWADATKDEARTRDELKNWLVERVITSGHVEIHDSKVFLYGNSSVALLNYSSATLHGNSFAKLFDDSSAMLHDISSATLCNTSYATLTGNSRAKLHGGSRAELFDDSRAELYGDSSATLHDNSSATLHDNSSAKLHDSSSATLAEGSDGKIIDERN